MTSPIGPPGRIDRSDGDRPDRRGRSQTARTETTLVPAGPVVDEPRDGSHGPGPAVGSGPKSSPTALAAQILGQETDDLDLYGDPALLTTARSTYLETEYSGPNDRRPKPGKATKSEI